MDNEREIVSTEHVVSNPASVAIARIRKYVSGICENRNLSLLFVGQVVSQIGDSIYQIGLLWFVLDLTGSKSAMGMVAMISYLPMLLFGLFSGILVDTFDRRQLMIVSDVLRAFIVLILPITFFTGSINLGIILLVSFALATFSTLFNPARDSLLPELVKSHRLVKANSLIQISTYSAILIGPALGAALIGVVGIVHLFSLDALTFLLSFFAILLIQDRVEGHAEVGVRTFAGRFSEILRYIHHDKRLRFLLGLTAVNNFFIMGPAIVGTPIFVKEILSKGPASYAIVESCLGLGMVLGSILVNYLDRLLGKGKILLLGLMFDGLTYALAYWCRSLELFMALIVFHAIGIPHIVVTRTSLIQEWIDPKLLGRVFSLVNMSVIGITAIATGVTGWAADYVSIHIIFGVFGTAGMLCGIIGWSYPALRNS